MTYNFGHYIIPCGHMPDMKKLYFWTDTTKRIYVTWVESLKKRQLQSTNTNLIHHSIW